jgi:hypothetical protein
MFLYHRTTCDILAVISGCTECTNESICYIKLKVLHVLVLLMNLRCVRCCWIYSIYIYIYISVCFFISMNMGIYCVGGVCAVVAFKWAEFFVCNVFLIHLVWGVIGDPRQCISNTAKPAYILTSTHPHIHASKTHRREHGDLLNVPTVALPTATLHTCTEIIPKTHLKIWIHHSKYQPVYIYYVFLQLTNCRFYTLQYQLGNFNYIDQKWIHFKLHLQQKHNIFIILHIYTW